MHLHAVRNLVCGQVFGTLTDIRFQLAQSVRRDGGTVQYRSLHGLERVSVSGHRFISSDQRPQRVSGDPQRLLARLQILREGLVLHLDAHRPVVVRIGEGRDPAGPVTSPSPGILAVLRSIGSTSVPTSLSR